eukprot:gb/GFBE01000651.1/.p1 GENE.gb/GFBE01000651.1/~~gb/GFBE01000651.1/.p1  ORF type:complete len:519 (+),score=99.82 gb/GFBE01000651.1/:1-1557(+)
MSRVLWVRSEVFDHGVFNTSIRWSISKVFSFLGTLKGSTSSTTLSRSAWMDVSTTKCKPALSEAEAAAYWTVFSVLQQSIVGNPGDVLEIRVIGIMLVCQLFSPNRVKAELTNKNEVGTVWNERAVGVSSPRHSPRGSPKNSMPHAALGRGLDFTNTLVAFAKQHLGYLMQIVTLSLLAEPGAVTVEEFDLLGLVLCAGTSKNQPLWRLSEAIPDLVAKKSMPAAEVRKAAQKLITWNEDVYTTDNAQPIQEPAAKTLNITGMSKLTWFHRPHNAEIEYLNIVDCKDCAIYVTARIRFCLISGCEGTTVILGGVSTLCTTHNCEKVSIHVAAHCYKMENCIDTSSYLFTHIPPIITGDTRGVKLAPYNVLHSHMASVLQGSRMTLDPAFVDVWAHPVCCTAGMPDETLRSRVNAAEEQNTTYHFVHPSKFFPVVVPENGPRGAALQLVLPEVYDKAMKERQEEMQEIQQQLSKIPGDAAKKKVHEAIQSHFRDWLQSTGKVRQLSDLAKHSMQFHQTL